MGKGTLYGVGVGPGDPGLLTRRACEIIERCPVVASPRTRNGGMVAYDIAAAAVSLTGKTVLPLDFAMSRDEAVRAESHQAAAAALRKHLDEGQSVALLNLGDIAVYASFRYLADILVPEGYPMEMIPGVTSFSAAASVLGMSLTDMNAPLHIIPEGGGVGEETLRRPGTTVYMKSGKQLPRLLRQIEDAGLIRRTKLVQNCGMQNQRVYSSLEGEEISSDYFTVVIVSNPCAEPEA